MNMSNILIGCDLTYSITSPSNFLFNIAAARTTQQCITNEILQLTPDIAVESNHYGTEGIQVYRLSSLPGELSLHYEATVCLSPETYASEGINACSDYTQLPSEILSYLNPSRYCESDRLSQFALRQFGKIQPSYTQVMAICDWIHEQIDYQAGSSNSSTSACDVLIQRVGVCRDFAHLGIALCRALCIPARYVSGYAVALQPPDFHGLFEAYIGSRWYLFDATRMAQLESIVRIGTGRDAADTSFATIIGVATLTTMSVWAKL